MRGPRRWANRCVTAIGDVAKKWSGAAWASFTGPHGYLVLVTAVGVYASLYKILEGQHQRLASRAASERAAMMSLVSTEHSPSFVSAMQNFGPIQTMPVPTEPDFFRPWTLLKPPATPNRASLWAWARDVLSSCLEGCKRDSETGLRFDLRRANFQGADLHEVNLSSVDLRDVDLERSNLRGANLQGANLVGANLRWADLAGANLRETNLSGANMQYADLRRANLSAATLRRAILAGADLRGADIRWANLRRANLDAAILDGADLSLADCGGASVRTLRGARAIKLDGDFCRIGAGADAMPPIRYRIGLSLQNLEYPFVAALQTAARSAGPNVDLVERDARNDVHKERRNVAEMILEDIDCLAFEAVKLDESAASIELANLAGVPVVQFNAKANGGAWVTFVGSEQAESGDLLGKWLLGFHEQSRKPGISGIYLRGVKGQATDVARDYALKARLKSEGFVRDLEFSRVVSREVRFVRKNRQITFTEVFAEFGRATGRKETAAILARNPYPDFIVANNDSMILGALEAVEARGLVHSVAMAGVDGLPETLMRIKEGRIGATVFQNPDFQGAGGVRACVDYLNGVELPKEQLVPFLLVTADNVDEVLQVANRVYGGARGVGSAP